MTRSDLGWNWSQREIRQRIERLEEALVGDEQAMRLVKEAVGDRRRG